MPIQGADLSIYGPQKGAVVPYVSSDQVAAQVEVEAAKQAKMQALRQSALDDARERAAVNASLDPKTGAPDPERFGAAAVKYQLSPERAAKVQKGFDDHYEAVGKQQTARDTHLEAQKKFNAERWGTITDQATLDVMREMYPEEFKNVPQDYESAKPNVQVMAQAATSEADKAKMRIEALKEQRDAVDDLPKSLAAAATFVANDDAGNYSNAINGGLKGLGWKQAVIDRLPQQYDAQKLADIAMGPKEVATLAGQKETRAAAAANTAADNKRADAQLAISRGHLAIAQQTEKRMHSGAAGAEAAVKPGTRQYREAQDLSDGTLTYADFLRLHGRAQAGAAEREAIYDTARQLNPNFNPAAFEIGYKFASNPKVRAQVASIKNVEQGVPDLLKFSEAAARSGSPTLNAYLVQPFKMSVGNKQYSNFKTAVTAFADELSGALGYGSATDMSREMGFSMTDMTQGPANFASNMRDVVLPFVARKKGTIVGEMGQYSGGANPETGAGSKKPDAKKDPLGIR